MPVTLLSPVEGKQVGETYTGPNEQYHVENGNAKWNSPHAVYNGVFTGVAYNHSTDPDGLYDGDFVASESTDGFNEPIDPSTVTNGDEPVRDFEPTTYGPADVTENGHLPEVSDPWVNPHA